MGEPFAESDDKQADISYFSRHRARPVTLHVLGLVRGWHDCKSVLDVGARSGGFLYRVDPRYSVRIATDIYKPLYMGGDDPKVLFIHGDFLDLKFDIPFDVVVCLEVLEHIDLVNRPAFAKKLLSLTKKHLLVSIPYMWKNSKEPMDHNNLHEGHIHEWFNRTDCTTAVFGRPAIGEHLLARFDL